MSRYETSIPPGYFDAMYAADPDPWRFAASDYERSKYAATLAALPQPAYRNALEVGCSIGVFTRQLARRCEALLALDVADAALTQAAQRCTDATHVAFARLRVPGAWPEARFDLLVLSEVVYYLDRDDVAALARRARDTVVPGGDIVLVHWLGETHYPLSGDEAVEAFTASLDGFARPVVRKREAAYRLDVLTVETAASAAAGGEAAAPV